MNTDDGPDSGANYAILNRGKRHDYFTSCLPWPQKGNSVMLPLGGEAPVMYRGAGTNGGVINNKYVRGFAPSGGTLGQYMSQYSNTPMGSTTNTPTDMNFGMYADLSQATSATINAIRTAFQVQKLLERDARGGTRYTEIIRSHFGVVSPDSRLQRPEYLGGRYRDWETDRKSTRLNSSHEIPSRMPSSA